jgi:hypothetical protein
MTEPDDELHRFAHALFAPDDEPDELDNATEPGHLVVRAEGSNPRTRITAEMVNRDFARRLFDDEYDIL